VSLSAGVYFQITNFLKEISGSHGSDDVDIGFLRITVTPYGFLSIYTNVLERHTEDQIEWGPGRLLPSDSAPVLQYGSRPSSDFIAKVLAVQPPPSLCNTKHNFSLSLLFLHKSRKRTRLKTTVKSRFVVSV
jgi:hypothetical protein